MKEDRNKISPGNTPRKSYLPWLVLGGLMALSGIVFLVFPPANKPVAPGPSPENSVTPPAAERPLPFPPSSGSRSTRSQSPKEIINPDQTVSVVEPDPLLQKLEAAFQAGRCDELMKLVGPSALEGGARQFYTSFIYSSGVGYWENKDYRKAANFMRCLLTYYQSYRDEALLVLTESEIALGDKAQARQHLQELKANYPNRKSEIEKLEQKLVLGK